jgi:N-acetylglucosaminyldiphosphoundecaprenol N-acetyl-beta-D-mannosaminyltransferase
VEQSHIRTTDRVLDANVDAITWDSAVRRIMHWATQSESRYVCFCNVHVASTARCDESFRSVVNGADMVAPDGAPVAWMLRRLGHAWQGRIDGPGMMWSLCAAAAEQGVPVFFVGSTPEVLEALTKRLLMFFPTIRIGGYCSPPFTPLVAGVAGDIVAQVHASRARIVFVGLGCPKQERWMAMHRGALHAVMLGVGAAFDFHAGRVKRAPLWMQGCGLEWVYRLVSEPQRLARRYLVTNSIFLAGAVVQLIKLKRSGTPL